VHPQDSGRPGFITHVFPQYLLYEDPLKLRDSLRIEDVAVYHSAYKYIRFHRAAISDQRDALHISRLIEDQVLTDNRSLKQRGQQHVVVSER